MTDHDGSPILPHHKLIALGGAKELPFAVRDAHVRDAKLREEALRSAKSACLNCAEGAGRVTRADKARAFAIARAETVDAAAALEIAAACGDSALNRGPAPRAAGFARGLRLPLCPHEISNARNIRFRRSARLCTAVAAELSIAPMATARSTAPTASCSELFACVSNDAAAPASRSAGLRTARETHSSMPASPGREALHREMRASWMRTASSRATTYASSF